MSGLPSLVRSAIPSLGALASVVGGSALWPAKQATRADLAPPRTPGRESWAESSDGVRLRVVEHGPEDAQPLVFAHGWTCTAEIWLPQVHALAERYRVITYDQRGHGQSGGKEGPFRLDQLGDDLSSVLAHALRDGERAVIAGHSMGGITIMSWAARHPDEVTRRATAAVLTGTAARHLPRRIKVQPLALVGSARGAALRRGLSLISAAFSLRLDFPLLRRARATRLLIRHSVLCDEARDADVDATAEMALTCPPKTRGGWFNALAQADVYAGLRYLTVPTAVVGGAKDRLLPIAHSYEIAQALAETGWLDRLVVYPGSGHMISLEATEQYNALVREIAEKTADVAARAGR